MGRASRWSRSVRKMLWKVNHTRQSPSPAGLWLRVLPESYYAHLLSLAPPEASGHEWASVYLPAGHKHYETHADARPRLWFGPGLLFVRGLHRPQVLVSRREEEGGGREGLHPYTFSCRSSIGLKPHPDLPLLSFIPTAPRGLRASWSQVLATSQPWERAPLQPIGAGQ